METHVDEWVPDCRNFSSISFYDKPLKRLKLFNVMSVAIDFFLGGGGVKEEWLRSVLITK